MVGRVQNAFTLARRRISLANEPTSRTTLTTQILVVGSGAIGSVFARLLVEAGCQVMMIDAGPALSDPPGDHLRNSRLYGRSPDDFARIVDSLLRPVPIASGLNRAAIGGQNPKWRMRDPLGTAASVYAVGGMLTVWSCVIPRPRGTQLLDLIPPAELDELYSVAESALGHDPRLTGRAPVDLVLSEHLEEAGYRVEPLPLAAAVDPEAHVVRYTGAAQVLGEARHSIELLPQHLCRELRWKRRGDGAVVEAAIATDLRRGRDVTIVADSVVVACNALLTPQLLFASGIWRDRLPALGRFLTEHPKLFGVVRMAHGLAEKVAARTTDLIRPADQAADVPAPALTIPTDVGAGRPWHTQITRDPIPAGVPSQTVGPHELVQLRWFAPCQPSRGNEVRFSGSRRDEFGMPRPTFDFSLSPGDQRVVAVMRDDWADVARHLGGFMPEFGGRTRPLGNSLHAAGTSRIGIGPATSVCDLDSRVWGFENLYLGGNGMIPNSHAVNPTLTAAALAVRAARALASRCAAR